MPPALEALASDPELKIDAFLCTAHVSAIIGANAYEIFVSKHQLVFVESHFVLSQICFPVLAVPDLEQAKHADQFSHVL